MELKFNKLEFHAFKKYNPDVTQVPVFFFLNRVWETRF